MMLTTAQSAAYQRILNSGTSAQAVRLPESHIRAEQIERYRSQERTRARSRGRGRDEGYDLSL